MASKGAGPPGKGAVRRVRQFSAYGAWEERYGEVGSIATGAAYAAALGAACARKGVRFVDMNSRLAAAATRRTGSSSTCAFNDEGNDIVARLLAESLELS